jgi:acyl carrier protein
VTVRAGKAGPQLVAWTESGGGDAPPEEAELRAFLAERLPEYMVPALWVTLERLPRTAGGKADRSALGRRELPSGDDARAGVATPYVAPETDAELVLAEIFAELLGVPRVGVDDDFFELGGHSLLLPQALYRLRETFAVEVPLRDFYDDPTVAGLAELVEGLILDQLEEGR